MPQKYKVYFSNRPVIFSTEWPESPPQGLAYEAFDSRGKMDTVLIEQAIGRGARQIYIRCTDVEKSWHSFREQFEFVQAAGGVVRNSESQILFIFRHEKWDLPKGKVEEGETIEQGALREIEEECSLSSVVLAGLVCHSWHTYIQDGIPVLKSTAWFAMDLIGNEVARPQLKEGITETRWMKREETGLVKNNTYPSILDVLSEYDLYLAHTPG